ncbi:Brain protein I3 [Chionoecetes opilio]|uniref:Membrane protein BRI3 n=1 Tax=Chionoecetes opilio TaxID=41210 RepID=A0A8J4Y890_CHIOP|nr:Brain protein I3 [Chionoecetes opilio]
MTDKFQQYPPPQQGPPPPYNQGLPVGFQPQGQGMYPPQGQGMYPPQGQVMYPPPQTSSTTVVTGQPMVSAQPMVIVSGGNCPACRSGHLVNEFTFCGICLGICFFPLGVICCLLMRERKCASCRASFGSA